MWRNQQQEYEGPEHVWKKDAKAVSQRVIAGISQNRLAANEIFRFIGIHFV